MAPAYELLHGLPEVAKYLGYDPRRLARAERAGTSQVGYEFLMRLHCARHHRRMADSGAEVQDSCPLSGRNLAFVRSCPMWLRCRGHRRRESAPQPPAAVTV